MKAPEDVLEIFLQPGEFYFGDEKTRIRTLLGSCVAITLWHPTLHIGGMCHYMLPQRMRRKNADDEALDGRYAADAMQMFLREIHLSRTRSTDYQVKLFGGGRMFAQSVKAHRHTDISERNVDFGRAVITQFGFKLAAQDLGGSGHRNVILDLWSGDVWVRKAKLSAAHADA